MACCPRIFFIAALLFYPIAPSRAQSTPPPAFEVASIRPHSGPLQVMMGLTISGTLIRMEGYNLPLLLMEAYHVKNYQLLLGATPHTDEFYDLALRAPGDSAPSREEVRRMLQTLLADRFKLAVHRETKVMLVYALVAGKNGPKLKENTSARECSSHAGPPTPEARNYEYKLSACTTDTLITLLSDMVSDRPIVDKTGLTGKYDISLVVTPGFKMLNQSDPDDISVFTAIKSLGLKLEARREPVEVIAVDHVEKPSEN